MTVSQILGIFKMSPNSWFNNKANINDMKIKKLKILYKKRNLAREQKRFYFSR